MGSRPVPVPIMAELKEYVSGLDPKQEAIFNRPFNQSRWTQIREKLCPFGKPEKKQNVSGSVTGLGVGDISLLEHLAVIPGHPAAGM